MNMTDKKLILGILLSAGFIATAFFLFSMGSSTPFSTPAKEKAVDTATVHVPNKEYGLATDSFEVVKGNIEPNQFLAELLLKHHVPYPEIDRLVKRADTIFDVKRIAAGKEFTIYCSKDSLGKAQCFVYRPNAVDYVVFDLRDSMRVYKGRKPVTTKTRTASGVINASLYLTLQENDISPVLALELAEIYAWSIDFYGIRKGDHFRVVYEEKFVDDRSIGIGQVKAAEFVHRDSSYLAFHFPQEEEEEYFDQNGNSLEKAFLKAPLKFSRISSRFSHRRRHPVLKVFRPHHGVDYAAPRGTPVRSVGDGTVIASGYSGGNGNYVKIRHNSIYTTMYLHLSSRSVRNGEKVEQGQLIGKVGSTGLSTGPHLDYRVYKHGSAVNPLQLELPPGDPVKKENQDSFQEEKAELLKVLEEVPFKGGRKPQV